LNGAIYPQRDLAADAIHVEQNVIKENVGSQDQVAVAFGGLNKISFSEGGRFDVIPVVSSLKRRELLHQHLMLFFTGFSRIASEVAESKIANLRKRAQELSKMREMVDLAIDILQDEKIDIEEFGRLLDQNWRYKRSLSAKVSTPEIDEIYVKAIKAGALGGKLLGAGSGGFMLLFAKPEKQEAVRQALCDLVHVPFSFDDSGSRVVLYQPNGL